MNKVIGIKIDVDTHLGMRSGVPALLSLFKKYKISASFFVPMGKDHTGRTIKRVFTRKGFLKKAGRVGVVSTYGIKTLLYGLLLPGPEVAKTNRHILHKIISEGHELGIHGHDHVYWHDHIKGLTRKRTEEEVGQLLRVYRELTGSDALSFAAPGWMINPHALRFLQENGLVYSSDTRGTAPFYPEMGGEQFHIFQMPTTLPTLDEVIGVAGTDIPTLVEYYLNAFSDGLNILTVHTELEGKHWKGFLEKIIQKTLDLGYTHKRLIDIATGLKDNKNIPTCRIIYGHIEGRAGEVCLQTMPETDATKPS